VEGEASYQAHNLTKLASIARPATCQTVRVGVPGQSYGLDKLILPE